MNWMTGGWVSVPGTDKRPSSSWVHPALSPISIEGFSPKNCGIKLTADYHKQIFGTAVPTMWSKDYF
jgi:hypothetical protein